MEVLSCGMTAFLDSSLRATMSPIAWLDTLIGSSFCSLNDTAPFKCVFRGQNSPPAKHHAILITSKFDTHECYDIAIGWPVNPPKEHWFFPWERQALLYPGILDTYYYEQVRPDFAYEEGQKIAIVGDTSDFEIADTPGGPAFAPENSLCIHVGKIVDVGKYHIGHNINTFGGCLRG